jgi:hypothetical protein
MDAMQWDGSLESIRRIMAWANEHPPVYTDDVEPGSLEGEPWVDCVTLEGVPVDVTVHSIEGDQGLSPGDWVVKGPQGEFFARAA